MIDLRDLSKDSAPGSFTKNPGFGKFGPGLTGLYQAIRAGFSGNLSSTDRQAFRSLLERDFGVLQLWLPNFFLFNRIVSGKQSVICVDEFVAHAILNPWGPKFDYLAFGVFHLNAVGEFHKQSAEQKAPTRWALQYLQERASPAVTWDESLVSADGIEDFLIQSPNFRAETTRKVATNYAFFFRASGLAGTTPSDRCNNFISLGRAPIFLILDRLHLEGVSFASPRQATNHIPRELLALSFGVDEAVVDEAISAAASIYFELGGYTRFETIPSGGIAQGRGVAPQLVLKEATEAAEIEYQLKTSVSRVRNRILSADLKLAYGNCCAVCGKPLIVDYFLPRFYGEAAHIRPLGRPHEGEDAAQNLIVLCPNHHVQFDCGIFTLVRRDSGIWTTSPVQALDGIEVNLVEGHDISDANIDFHRTKIFKRAPIN